MNRILNSISLTQKLTVLALVAAGLFAIPTYDLWSKAQATLVYTEGEQQAIPLMEATLKLLDLAQQHRRDSLAVIAKNGTQAELKAQNDTINQAIDELDAQPQVRSSDTLKKTVAVLRTQFADINTSAAVSAAVSIKQHSSFIDTLFLFQADAASETGLALDPEAVSYFLYDAGGQQLPPLLEALGRTRGYGIAALNASASKSPDAAAQISNALLSMQNADAMYVQFDNRLDKAIVEQKRLQDPEMVAELGKLKTQMQAGIAKAHNAAAALQQETALPTVESYTQTLNAVLADGYNAGHTLNSLLHGELDQRLTRVNGEIANLRWLSLALVLILIGFSAGVSLSITRPLGRAMKGAQRIATGDLSDTQLHQIGSSETSRLLQSLNVMRENLLTTLKKEREIATKTARISAALDATTTSIMIADADRNIVYINPAQAKLLAEVEADIRKDLPQFNARAVIGVNIDDFHKNPTHQRILLSQLRSTHVAHLTIGGRRFKLVMNPIINADGTPAGTVVEWLDITREVAIEKEVSDIIQAAALGDFKQRIPMADKDGFFKLLAENMNTLMATSDQGLAEVVRMLGALAGGDLTERITNDYSGTFGQLKDDSNATAEKLTDIISQIKEATDAIGTAAQEIASGNQNLSQRTESQAASLEETASSMEELTSTVKQNAENAKHANQLARGASDIAIKGGGVVEQVVTTMREINDSAKKIVDIIGVIDGIAFQTNILALNAAVEAARAGEQGRGFAVVASEVRNLAQRSAAAAKEIKSLIGDSVDKVESGSKLVDEAGRTMGEVVTAVKRVTDIMSEISAASVEQSAGIEQVNTTITQMDDMTQQNAALVEQAAAAAESMEEQSQSLSMAVAAFRLSEDAGRSMMPARRSATALPAPKASTSKVKAKSLPKPKADGDDWEEF